MHERLFMDVTVWMRLYALSDVRNVSICVTIIQTVSTVVVWKMELLLIVGYTQISTWIYYN